MPAGTICVLFYPREPLKNHCDHLMPKDPSRAPQQMTTSPRILVFDSGVGGLSIMREIQARIPTATIIYASDNAAFPYGTKTEEALIVRVTQVIQMLATQYHIDIMVIACNTASTLTLPHLRGQFPQPIVGVVPAIKPAARLTKTGVIGLLATPATVARPYTHDLIREHAPNCKVVSVGSSELVHIAEQKLRGQDISTKNIAAITQAFLADNTEQPLDVLVLACTHFPLLRQEIADSLPEGIQLIDSGEAIARRVEFLLQQQVPSYVDPHNQSHQVQGKPAHIALFTQATQDVKQLKPALAQFGIDQIDYVF